MDAVVNAVGKERTAIRISPFSAFLEPVPEDVLPLFQHYVSELDKRQILYVHCTEARVGTMQTMMGALPVPLCEDHAQRQRIVDLVDPQIVVSSVAPSALPHRLARKYL